MSYCIAMSNQSISDLLSLNHKVAIITGASKGIGAAIAKSMAEYGAKVVISSRKQEAVDAIAAEIKQSGYEATAIACHVGHADQLQALVDKTVEQYGGIDILVNNAAINPIFGPITEATSEVFDKIMNVNVKACFLLANMCHSYLKQGEGGSVINIASVEGLKPGMGLGLYSVSKAALIMLTKNQAREWGKDHIRVNAIAPGLIQTKFSAAIWQNEQFLNKIVGDIPAGRMGQVEEMAGLALYLASAASSYCTGEIFIADGGYMLT
ncbi:MAG: glucose 1-dehydrogenase [Chitinophagales bacterium]|nr:glucose 1-dehydrogenase [Chitinophagales bacterium]